MSGYDRGTAGSATDFTPAYGGSNYTDAVSATEPEKPGLLDRFKETQAFDRLQSEVSSLGDRFVDELSNVARYQVLPALLGKVKEMFGIDLSGDQQSRRGGTAASSMGYSGSAESMQGTYSQTPPSNYGQESGRVDDQRSSDPHSTSSTTGSTSFDTQQGGSYGTSVNRDYGQ
jgi:hypothetical protein